MAEMPQQQRTTEDTAPVSQPDVVDRSMEGAGPGTAAGEEEENTQLLGPEQHSRLDSEWQAIQATFVDSPRASVEKADALVSKTIDAMAGSFADMRNSLESTWEKDREVSTEDLRLALQNYRSFFRRLLSV